MVLIRRREKKIDPITHLEWGLSDISRKLERLIEVTLADVQAQKAFMDKLDTYLHTANYIREREVKLTERRIADETPTEGDMKY